MDKLILLLALLLGYVLFSKTSEGFASAEETMSAIEKCNASDTDDYEACVKGYLKN
jgi:hypothetical protein